MTEQATEQAPRMLCDSASCRKRRACEYWHKNATLRGEYVEYYHTCKSDEKEDDKPEAY
jgi:hypothetical protein